MDRASFDWGHSMAARLFAEQVLAQDQERARAVDCHALHRCPRCQTARPYALFALLIDHKSIKMITDDVCRFCRQLERKRERERA